MIKIDKNKCIGCGACVAVCPEGFELKNRKANVKKNVPCSSDAINACPVSAISE